MKSLSPKVKKKAKEIVGDLTGIEAAKKLAEYFSKNSKYYYYGYGLDGKPTIIKRRK